ncbi:hypothetical protein Hanom_Chr07g00595591 [Helianthus anomalus]
MIYLSTRETGNFIPLIKVFFVQSNELSIDEIPSRALMWRKARENKNEEYKNVVKDMADKLVSLTLNFFGFIF